MRDSECNDVVIRVEVDVQLPEDPPILTPELARVLARILVKAGRTHRLDAILEPAELEALAS
jgi:hypothetical protein